VIGQGARALAYEVQVTFRRARPHERVPVPPGYRPIIAIADVPTGPEEQAWAVPHREAKRVLNPRNRTPAQQLAAGTIPPGWQRL
jgi:hypothetical protein